MCKYLLHVTHSALNPIDHHCPMRYFVLGGLWLEGSSEVMHHKEGNDEI